LPPSSIDNKLRLPDRCRLGRGVTDILLEYALAGFVDALMRRKGDKQAGSVTSAQEAHVAYAKTFASN
jgi:hypothetical protein